MVIYYYIFYFYISPQDYFYDIIVDLLTIWYYGMIFNDLLNYCLEVYQDSRPPALSAPKGNRRLGVLLVKVFSLKHKANQILSATTKKNFFLSFQESSVMFL